MNTEPDRDPVLEAETTAHRAAIDAHGSKEGPNPAYTAFGNSHGGFGMLVIAALVNGALAGLYATIVSVTMSGSTVETKSEVIFPLWGSQIVAFVVMLFLYLRWMYAIGTLITLASAVYLVSLIPF